MKARGVVSLLGLIMLSVGAALYSKPSGLILFGLGLYIDSLIGTANGRNS